MVGKPATTPPARHFKKSRRRFIANLLKLDTTPSRAAISAQDRKSAAAVGAETENGEVGVEGSRALNSQAAHDGEAGAVHDRKILVAPRDAHLPRGFQIRGTNGF